MSKMSENLDIAFVGTGDPSLDNFPDPNSGGSGPIWRLAREFEKRGHNVSIYSSTFEDEKEHYIEGVRIIPIRIPKLPINYRISGLGLRVLFSYRTCKQLKQKCPDVVYSRERLASIFPSRLDFPTVFTVVSPDACDFYYSYSVDIHPLNRVLFHYKKWVEYTVCTNASKVITMNNRASEYYKNKGIKNISTVSVCIGKEKFIDLSNIGEKNKILFVGRLDDNKRPEWALEAYSNLDLNKEHELIIIGSGHRQTEIKQLADELGIREKTTFTGKIPREQVLGLMAGAKALILPSKFEMAGNVIIEAMASGCPVIASDTMGARYLIEDGKTGLLFNKTEKKDLNYQLERCLNNKYLREYLRNKGRKVARNQFTTEKIADEYLTIGWKSVS